MATKKGANNNDGDSFLEEVEKTGNAIINEVKQLFDRLTRKVSDVTGSATDTTVNMAEKVSGESAERLRAVVKDVREVGEASIETIGEQFEGLKHYVLNTGTAASTRATATASKQRTTKKAKTTVKSAGTKKVAVKKKSTAKKKTTAKKKVAAKQKTGSRQAAAKKTVKKKVVKKQASKKKVGKKQTARKSASS